jgi:transcriptional regulator with XRE-family HTH domain
MDKDIVFISRLEAIRGTMTRTTFAKRCGIKTSTMRNYLVGETTPRLNELRRIAAACNTTVGWLVGDETPVPLPKSSSHTAHGDSNIQIGGAVEGSSFNSGGPGGGNYLLTPLEAERLELDRKYGNDSIREKYKQQLLKIKAVIEG